ncbi:ribonuclease Z [Vibrio salinus]|uniref:ribonuclease Z n=1 Tax=Vibrio salinus TaxID=2899784 RepID=UPI001E2AC9EA|nr:ribonuclease Z [Vibrio salinus]MCE0495390.1 ribonuclease Z [Vibrio salinus]
MELHFLGTSAGVPTKNRNVSAIGLSESKGKRWYLIDCGEGTQHQLLRSRLSLNSLEAIFITHVHGDHCYGLPGVLASAGMNGRKTPLTIVAPRGIQEWLEATQKHTVLNLPYELRYLCSETDILPDFGQFTVSATALSHVIPSFSYGFTENDTVASLDTDKLAEKGIPRGPLWGELQAGADVCFNGKPILSRDFLKHTHKPRKIIICGDNDTPSLLKEECINCDVLVHEATFTETMAEKAREFGHSFARQVAQFSQDNRIPNLLLTHFSPRFSPLVSGSPSIHDLKREAESVYSGQLFLAEDFQRYRLDKMGVLSLSDRTT